jgi:hypothetical protein
MNKPTTVIDPALVQPKSTAVSQALPQNNVVPMSQADRLVEMAIQSGADIERLDKLLDLKERYDREDARKQFTAALADFKAEDVQIVKDKGVGYKNKDGSFTGYKHATLGNVVGTAVPHMSKHGLSHRWNVEQSQGSIKVTCILTHKGGHSEEVSMFAAPDDTGKKNSIQQVASTVTYLERYTFLSITGLAVEDQADDDGQQAEVVIEYINMEQVNALHSKITDNELDMEIFLRWLATSAIRAASLEDIPADRFKTVMSKVDAGIKAKADAAKDPS